MLRLRLFVLLLLFVVCTSAMAQQSADEQTVWKLEHDYWNYVKAFDLDGYRTLWHKDFTGWPYMSATPVHKDHITDWLTDYKNKGQHVESFVLKPAASRANPNGVVTFYTITEHLLDKNGKAETSTARITHTWIKSGNTWQIISGMSSAVGTK